MEKNTSGLIFVFAIFALLIGGLVGYNIGPTETVEVEKIVYQNVSVEKLVKVPAPDMLSLAVDAFIQAVEDEEDEAGNDVDVIGDYYFNEIEVVSVADEYNVSYDNEMITVDFSIKLRFDDGDTREKTTYDVTVIFEEDEDTEVTAD